MSLTLIIDTQKDKGKSPWNYPRIICGTSSGHTNSFARREIQICVFPERRLAPNRDLAALLKTLQHKAYSTSTGNNLTITNKQARNFT